LIDHTSVPISELPQTLLCIYPRPDALWKTPRLLYISLQAIVLPTN